MRALAGLMLWLLAACGGTQRANETAAFSIDRNDLIAPDPPCDPFDPCAVQDRVRMDRELAALEQERQRLIRLFTAGRVDPAGDAGRAAAQGDFRLYWIEDHWAPLHTIGPLCRIPAHPATGRPALIRFEGGSYDYTSDCAPFGAGGRPSCPLAGAHALYMRRFNEALVADPRFPYADLCGPEDPAGTVPRTLRNPNRVLTEAPRSLGEAARRGSPASVSRLLRGQDAATLNRPDGLGLTPLAWAMIEQRPDIALLLMAAGADPLDGHTRWRSGWLPLETALATPNSSLVARMLTPAVTRRLQPWPCQAVRAAVQGDHVALVRRMLGEPNRCRRIWELRGRSAAMTRLVDQMDPRPGIERLSRAIKARSPAQVRQALRTGSNPDVVIDPEHWPLRDALRAPEPAMLPMVRLLLAAGANPNGPAIMPDVPGSARRQPILAQLIAEAASRDPFETSSPRLTSLRRALDLLLAAGASLEVQDWQGRPLAVMAVIGTGVHQPLPPGWLTRLKQAGVDVNATWQGSTALDWLEARGGGDSDTARELIRLAGRRLRTATVEESDRLPRLPPGVTEWPPRNRSR